jgi:DNA-3-methyladenine glycosylase II
VIERLDERGLARGVAELTRRDPALAAVVERHGPPPLWPREPGFATLVRLILEQQVSLGSGQAAFGRLARAVGTVDATAVLAADEERLRAAGLTRQKTRYVRALANAIVSGELVLDRLRSAPDDAVRTALLAVTGIGPWTADCYLLFALGRPDAWPTGDLALAVAAEEVKRMAARPSRADLDRLAEPWRPWRGVAARLLWHSYLSVRGRADVV